MKTTLAIDGSLVAFRAAAAGEKRTILTRNRHTGEMKEFGGRTKFKDWLKEQEKAGVVHEGQPMQVTDFEIEDLLDAQEEGISLHICDEMIKEMLSRCQADEYIIYLDSGKTFRHELATVQEYKGNRQDQIRPVNLQAVKDHMVLRHTTKVVTGLEADDYVNFHQWRGYNAHKTGKNERHIAATFDKDAFGNPGWVFDFRKDENGKPIMPEPVLIDGLGDIWVMDNKRDVKGLGVKFLYFQWIAGDRTDNYKPNKLSKVRFGDIAAFELLKDLKTHKECIQAVADTFRNWYPEPVEYTSWDGKPTVKDWVGLAQEYLDLCRMRRSPSDLVNVEDVFRHLEVDVSLGRVE